MNIGRWLLRRGPLIVATLAMTGAAVIAPVPASAGAANIFCNLSSPYPQVNAARTLVTADAHVTCFGGVPSGINLSLDLARDGVIVASTLTGGSAVVVASCVPGNYVATAWATIWYPFGNIPASDSIRWQSPSVYISCTAPPVPTTPVVANPGNQSTLLRTSATLQMTATGGTSPYTWSATGLPTGLSINPSTGLISGTVTQYAAYTVTVTAVDTAGRAGSAQFGWRVRLGACGSRRC
ncbi:MAG TPA: Ig domain-containing protein [Micromonosporaceae bacterium]|nr:Ig domain-containing protein [Micromonosporaceae bacterium]